MTHWYAVTAILCDGRYSEVHVPARRSPACHLSLLEHGLLDSGDRQGKLHFTLQAVGTLVFERKKITCVSISDSKNGLGDTQLRHPVTDTHAPTLQ